LWLAETHQNAGILAEVHNMLGLLYEADKKWALAGDHFRQSLAIAQQPTPTQAEIAALNNLGRLSAKQGDLSEAKGLLMKALALCQQLGDRHREAALHSNLADLWHDLGEEAFSREHFRQSVLIFRELGEQDGNWQPEIWKLTEW
jgi:tetratricopeptide (TPR) repeat protein